MTKAKESNEKSLKTLIQDLKQKKRESSKGKDVTVESNGSFLEDSSQIKCAEEEEVFLWQWTRSAPYCLCEANTVPDWQFQHRRMRFGYRKALSFSDTIYSLFYFHNESVNIWLHYLGTAALLWKIWCYYQKYDSVIFSASPEYQFDFYVLFLCTLMGNCFPILTSGLCHHFYCINQNIHKGCWFLDFMGMLSGITFVSSNFLYLTFYCMHHPDHQPGASSASPDARPTLLSTYSLYHQLLTILIGGYLLAIYFCWKRYSPRLSREHLFPKDRFPEFSSTLTFYSIFVYTISIGYSVFLHPEYLSDPVLRSILIESCLYPVAMGLGIVVFAQGAIPERFNDFWGLPSHFFDLVGHSHQWWHVVSFTVLFFWIDVVFHHYEVKQQMTCPLPPL